MLILAADIGGTHSRFQLFVRENGLVPEKACVLPTRGSMAMLLEAAKSRLLGSGTVSCVAIAAAGPKKGDGIALTNAPLRVSKKDVEQVFPGARCLLMNDFEAQAWACLTPVMKEVEYLLPRDRSSVSPKENIFTKGAACPVLVLGAGTGLGVACLVPGRTASGYSVLPSEAGHIPFPFRREEGDLCRALADGPVLVTAEELLSGAGLRRLHALLAGNDEPPEVFTAREMFPSSGVCAQYAAFLGRFCRMMALSFLPGALVITGGVAGRTPALVRHEAFAREFLEGPCREQLAALPVLLSLHPFAGLWGVAFAAAEDSICRRKAIG